MKLTRPMRNAPSIALQASPAILIGVILALDLLTPTGFPIWVFFVIPLLLVVPLHSEQAIRWTAALIALLTIAGAMVSPAGISVGLALLHRSMGILVFVVIAGFQISSLRAHTARDRSEEKLRLALQHKDVLMKELQHRVKNSLGLVASMLRLEGATIDDPDFRTSIDRSTSRIAAVAKAYALLDKTPGSGTVSLEWYLADILESLATAYLNDDGRVRLSHRIEATEIDTRRAVALGLIVNELLTNAIKHAFPDDTGGSIMVTSRRCHDALHLSVRDTGRHRAGATPPRQGRSQGLNLVDLLTEELAATMSVHTEEGYEVCLTVPLEDGGNASGPPVHTNEVPDRGPARA